MAYNRHSMPARPYSEYAGFYPPPETDPSNPALNLIKLKGQARKLGRTDSSGTSVWNPFRIIDHGANAKVNRRSTAGDVEAGLHPRDADMEEMSPITQRSTAPDRLATPLPDDKGNAPEGASQGSPRNVQFDSPSSTQPITSEANGNMMRNRKPNSAGADGGAPADGGELERKKSKEEKKNALFKHVHPKEPFTVANQLQRTILNSWINILLLAVPAGFAVNYAGLDGRVIFTVNFIAIVPLAAMLGFATEEIALRTGETLGGLINATFGNAVELIVAVIALIKDEIVVVQTSLIGSILSNLLLVLGMCFFFGGFNRPKQSFNQVVAQTAASLLALAVASNIIPTIFKNNVDDPNTPAVEGETKIAAISRGVSVILLFVYCCYLYFQLKTHADIFNETSEKTATYNASAKSVASPGVGGAITGAALMAAKATQGDMKDESGTARLVKANNTEEEDDEEEEEEPQLHFWVAVATLTVSTVLIAFCAEFMVDGISAITTAGHVSEEFVGLILLPIVGNAAEHATAVTVAVKDKMDLAIGVAVGSSMQVSLFLIPLLVIIGWGMGLDNMNLAFDTFQIVVLFVSVLLVNYLIGDGESHWLEGVLLVCLYLIIAVCAWYYPAHGVV